MAKKSLLLVSLEESEAKHLANVLSNDNCRKIIDYLSSNNSRTSTEISENLGIPLPTVHYNLQQLLKAKIVNSQEFHYSKKGREVSHYSLANKYVIFSPKPVKGLKEKLKELLPAVLITAGIAAVYKLTTLLISTTEQAAYTKEPTERMLAADSASQTAAETGLANSPLLWFLIGALTAFLVYILWTYFRNIYINRKSRQKK